VWEPSAATGSPITTRVARWRVCGCDDLGSSLDADHLHRLERRDNSGAIIADGEAETLSSWVDAKVPHPTILAVGPRTTAAAVYNMGGTVATALEEA